MMVVCVGERLDPPGWTGLPLGRFNPPPVGGLTAVAATQDSLFLWNDDASPAQVRVRERPLHYVRQRGVFDIMATEEQVFVSHDKAGAPGSCLVVALPATQCADWFEAAELERFALGTRFGLTDPHLHDLARALEAQCESGEPWGRLYTQSVSIALASYVLHRYSDGGRARFDRAARVGRGRLTTAQQARIVRYVEAKVEVPIDLAELARLAGYSTPHFIRLFRQAFGISPYKFVIQRRIERAKHLLAQQDLAVREVSRACGFTTESHFSGTFARRVGLSPTAYREAVARARRSKAAGALNLS